MSEKIENHSFSYVVLLALLSFGTCMAAGTRLEFPGPAPGDAQGKVGETELILENEVLACAWDISQGRLRPKHATDKKNGMWSNPTAWRPNVFSSFWTAGK